MKRVLMLVLCGVVVGCGSGTTRVQPETKAEIKKQLTDEEWGKCESQVFKEKEDQGIRETGNPNAYIGANGMALRSKVDPENRTVI